MAKKKKLSKRETEKLLDELDDWMDVDQLPPEGEDEEDELALNEIRQETNPKPPEEVEPTVKVTRRKLASAYGQRPEFDAEKYDVSKSLVAHEHIEYEVTPEPEKPLKKAYRPPKNDPVFKQKWNTFIHNVVARDNFNRSHLEQLTVLCDLFVEYEILIQSLKRTGYTFIVNTAIGAVPKPYPEVSQLNRTRGEIRNYSRMLGLLLVKDKSEKEPDEDEWE